MPAVMMPRSGAGYAVLATLIARHPWQLVIGAQPPMADCCVAPQLTPERDVPVDNDAGEVNFG